MAPTCPTAPPPPDPSGLSELIRDFELETRFLNGDTIQHFFYRRGTSSENRRRKLAETWVRIKRLGSGSYGSEIRIDSRARFTARRELEAIFTFSHNRLLEGLRYMHDKNFVHRDLKPENILVVSSGPNWLVQICDFGLTRRLEEGNLGTMRQGTLGYIAPELLGFVAEKRYPFAVDMWSLGCVIYRVLTGRDFLGGVDDLLRIDPGTRLKAAAAAEHKWMLAAARESLLSSTDIDDTGCSTASPSRNSTIESNVPLSAHPAQQSMPSAQWSWQTTNPNALGFIDDMIFNHDKKAPADGKESTAEETDYWTVTEAEGEDGEEEEGEGTEKEEEKEKKVEGEESYEAEDEKEEVESDEENEGLEATRAGKPESHSPSSLSSLITTFKGLEVSHPQQRGNTTSSDSDTIGRDTPGTRLSSLSVHSGAKQKRRTPGHQPRDTMRDLLVGTPRGHGRRRRRFENRLRSEKRLRGNNHYRINKQQRAPQTSRNPIGSPSFARHPPNTIDPYRNRSNRGTTSRQLGETGFLEGIPSKIVDWLSRSFSVFSVFGLNQGAQ
ncbi:hypothetical protein VTJ49DRAFT_772 [Mycothermus thermophilus]|uniref:Protein kinase domain-containing protein n=1 Tax=Humicola insolens TaxID=85995 RepID=A0ABR3VFC8_HUMIN